MVYSLFNKSGNEFHIIFTLLIILDLKKNENSIFLSIYYILNVESNLM